MPNPLHAVAETARFIRDAEAAGVDEQIRRVIVDTIAADPIQGDEVQGSGGVRKMRVAGRGKGKRGGYRVMVACLGPDMPVYLLALLSKSDRANFTPTEIAAMRAATMAIRQAWRRRQKI